MRAFLRENVAVVIGVCLPIAVMAFFMIANSLPRAFVEPPRYDLLLVGQDGQYDPRPVRIAVTAENGRVRARMYRTDRPDAAALAYAGASPRLFRWDHETGAVREISLPLPDDLAGVVDGDDLPIEELAGVRVSMELAAPDGYAFRTPGYDRGLFGFWFDGGAPRPMIAKDGASRALEMPGDWPYWNAQFLAWIVE